MIRIIWIKINKNNFTIVNKSINLRVIKDDGIVARVPIVRNTMENYYEICNVENTNKDNENGRICNTSKILYRMMMHI